MRGVKEELFGGLVRNPPKIVAEFVTEATTIEKTLEMRVKQYDRNFVGAANANNIDNIRIPADSLRWYAGYKSGSFKSDAALPVIKGFIAEVKQETLGHEVIKSISTGQVINKIIHEEMINLSASSKSETKLN